MKIPPKYSLGPIQCSSCSINEMLDVIETCVNEPGRGLTINMINAHVYNLCWTDVALRDRINRSDIVAADGMVIVWSAPLFGFGIPERCNMTDSFRMYLARKNAAPVKAVLIGGTVEMAEKAARAIERDGPHVRITRTISGYLATEQYRELLKDEEPPDMVLLGMGTPKTEHVSEFVRKAFPHAVVWHVGGGSFMFFAGIEREAPEWMRRCGIQWLHRLTREPGRMWRRYVIGNPLYVLRILRTAFFHRGRKPENVA